MIMCARCNKPVNTLYVHDDALFQGRHFIVECHDAVDHLFWTYQSMEEANEITPGWAFVSKHFPDPKVQSDVGPAPCSPPLSLLPGPDSEVSAGEDKP